LLFLNLFEDVHAMQYTEGGTTFRHARAVASDHHKLNKHLLRPPLLDLGLADLPQLVDVW
jgi:hypothetical protein